MSSTSSTTDRSAAPEPARVVVARIHTPHGVRGELSVEVLSEVPERFARGSQLWLVPAAGVTGDGPERRVRVANLRSGAGIKMLLTLDGVDSREAADLLRGATLEVDQKDVPAAPVGAYYAFELLDAACVDEKHGELGRIEAVREDGGGWLLVVRGGGVEVLIPFVESMIVELDRERRILRLRLPEGLLEACASPY